MIVYNVTSGVDKAVEVEWLQWMKEVHLPQIMKTGMFVSYKFYKVLSGDDQTSVSYAVQFMAPSMNNIEKYLDKFAPQLRNETKKRFNLSVTSFRTLLQEI